MQHHVGQVRQHEGEGIGDAKAFRHRRRAQAARGRQRGAGGSERLAGQGRRRHLGPHFPGQRQGKVQHGLRVARQVQAAGRLFGGDGAQHAPRQVQRDRAVRCLQRIDVAAAGECDGRRQWLWQVGALQLGQVRGLRQDWRKRARRPGVSGTGNQLFQPPDAAFARQRQALGGQRRIRAVVPHDALLLRPAPRCGREQFQPGQARCVVRVEAQLQFHAISRCVPVRAA